MNLAPAIKRLPSGLSCLEAARRLGVSYGTARSALQKSGYRAADGRRFSQMGHRKIIPSKVNWAWSNVKNARKWGVSRQRFSVLRKQLGKPFVESRGRPRNP